MELIAAPLAPYRPEPITFSTPLIPVIYGQSEVRKIPERFLWIDAWAAPIHKVMNLDGKFRSRDLKDYLGLSAHQKLILSTAGPDDYMEMLWEKGEMLDYRGHGFDEWFPAHFSVYDNDSKFYQFFNARRQQLHARKVKSRFVWFRLGEHVPVEWLGPILDCPSILLSCQQMYSGFNRRLLRREIELADRLFPISAAFFLLGSGYGALIRESRRVYEIHSGWLMRGLKGHDMKHTSRKDLGRLDLLCLNLKSIYGTVLQRRRKLSQELMKSTGEEPRQTDAGLEEAALDAGWSPPPRGSWRS
ncbi:MAG TPA: hypothetical protein VF789_19385 [Thermoanaerobaculia bacterium]